jgi:thioredoxin-dependent peroxiredoxin
MGKLAVSSKAPSISLQSTQGGLWSLKAAAGQNVVLYFYPRDNTSGCTKEGLDFAALHANFRKANCLIVGVSPDTLASHQKFKEKQSFPFDLLADPDKLACAAYDVMQPKSLYGRKYIGVERSTFLVDGKGVLRQIWRKVKVAGHAEAVLAAARVL